MLCVRPLLDAGDKAVNKADKSSCAHGADVLLQEDRKGRNK